MRIRRNGPLAVLILLLAGCATIAPPVPGPPSLLGPEASAYRSTADAPRLLESIDKKLADRQATAADLSTPDLTAYSGLLLAAGRLAEADQAYLILDARTPGNRTVLLSLALLAGARGDSATQALRAAALEKAFPGDPDAAGIRARLASLKGDRAGAQAAWQAVLVKREDSTALAALSDLALGDKRLQEARSWADRAVKADPADDQAWAAHARVETAQGRYLAAKADLDRAVDLSPQDPWHRLDRGKLAWLHLYAPTAAQADLEYAALQDPDNFFAWSALGEVYEENNQPRKAYDAWMRALSLRPDYRFAYPSAAMLAFRYLDFPRAAAFAKEAALDHPAEYAFPFVEALSRRALGQPQAAQKVLEKARPRFDRGSTVDEMFRFLLTPGMDYHLNTAMKLETKENVRLRLRFYQGCYYALIKADNSARAAFQEASESTLTKIPEIGAARDWLEHGP